MRRRSVVLRARTKWLSARRSRRCDSAVNKLNEPPAGSVLLDWMFGGSGCQFIKHLKREALTRDIPGGYADRRGKKMRRGAKPALTIIAVRFSAFPRELVARTKPLRRISPDGVVEEVIEMQD